jgi:hypothetical protein
MKTKRYSKKRKTRGGFGKRLIDLKDLTPIKDLTQQTDECNNRGGYYNIRCGRFGTVVMEDARRDTYLLKSKHFPLHVDMEHHHRMIPVLNALNKLKCEYLMKFYGFYFCQNQEVSYQKGLYRLLLEDKDKLCMSNRETKDSTTLIFYLYDYKCNAVTLKQTILNLYEEEKPEFKAIFRATIFCILHLLRWLQKTIGFVHHDFNSRNIMLVYHEKPTLVSFPGFKKELHYVPYIIDFDDSTIQEESTGIDENAMFFFLLGTGLYTEEELDQIKLNFATLTS